MAANHAAAQAAQTSTPYLYNAAADLIERNLAVRPDKTAYIDEQGSYSFADLARARKPLRRCLCQAGLGLAYESRVMVCLLDTIDFPSVFLGAIKAGLIPIAVNTLLTASDFDFMLRDSRAQALIVSAPLLPVFEPILRTSSEFETHIILPAEADGKYAQLAKLAGASAGGLQSRADGALTTPASGSTLRDRQARPKAWSTSKPA